MRQSKTEFTCASPKKKDASVRNGKQSLLCLIKNVSGDSHLHSLVCTFCQHFTENPLFIFNKILAIIMYIPPTFPFFFYDKIGYYHIYSSYLSCSDAFATTIINIWPLKRKKGASEGVVPPQKPGFPSFRNCLEGEILSAKRKNPRVGSRPAYYIIVYIGPLIMGSRGKALDNGPRHRPLV